LLGIAEMKIGEQFPPLAHLILVAHLLAGSASRKCPLIEEQIKHTVAEKSEKIRGYHTGFYPSPVSRQVVSFFRRRPDNAMYK